MTDPRQDDRERMASEPMVANHSEETCAGCGHRILKGRPIEKHREHWLHAAEADQAWTCADDLDAKLAEADQTENAKPAYAMAYRLEPPELQLPLADLAEARWTIWVCSRCLKPEHELPADVGEQIAGLRAGTWPTPGMRGVWLNTCHCGGVVREVEVMVKPGRWECPDCDIDMGAPTCDSCEADQGRAA